MEVVRAAVKPAPKVVRIRVSLREGQTDVGRSGPGMTPAGVQRGLVVLLVGGRAQHCNWLPVPWWMSPTPWRQRSPLAARSTDVTLRFPFRVGRMRGLAACQACHLIPGNDDCIRISGLEGELSALKLDRRSGEFVAVGQHHRVGVKRLPLRAVAISAYARKDETRRKGRRRIMGEFS